MILAAMEKSIILLFTFDKELYEIVFATLKITTIAIIIAGCLSIPISISIDLLQERIRRILMAIFNSLLAIPTVVIGLFVYLLISKSGPLGSYNLLFTPTAIIIGQILLAIPIIVSIILAGLTKSDKLLHETLITLGAKKLDIMWSLFVENRALILSAILAGFGRVIAEIGVAMMLGGNIRGYTRTITTAIALETGKGEFALALSLGFILIFFAVLINFAVYFTFKKEYILREV